MMVDFKLMLYTDKSREPPEVGVVGKLTGSFIGGWSSACQPYIESATALSDSLSLPPPSPRKY